MAWVRALDVLLRVLALDPATRDIDARIECAADALALDVLLLILMQGRNFFKAGAFVVGGLVFDGFGVGLALPVAFALPFGIAIARTM